MERINPLNSANPSLFGDCFGMDFGAGGHILAGSSSWYNYFER